jgi:hypothetical protein
MCDVSEMVQKVQVHMQQGRKDAPRESVSQAEVERCEGQGSSRQELQCLAKHTTPTAGPFSST